MFDIEGRKIVLSVTEFFSGKDAAWAEYVAAHPVQEMKKILKKVAAEKEKSGDDDLGEGKEVVEEVAPE